MDKLKEEIGLLKLVFGLVFIPWVSLLGWLGGQVVKDLPRKFDLEAILRKLEVTSSDSQVVLALLVWSGMSIFLLSCLLEIRRKIDEL